MPIVQSTSTGRAPSTRVAVVLTVLDSGGHERMLIEWLRTATLLGFQVDVHVPAESDLPPLLDAAGLAWHATGHRRPRPGQRARTVMWQHYRETVRTLAGLPAEAAVLLAPGAMQTGLSHLWAALCSRRKLAAYVPMAFPSSVLGASRPGLRDALTGWLARRVGRWITISSQQSRLLQQLWRVQAPVIVIPNRLSTWASDCAEMARPVPRKAPIHPGRQTVLFAGRFDPFQKGLDWLADLLSAGHLESHVHIIAQGKGPGETVLRTAAARAGGDRLRLLPWGPVSFDQADVLLLCSRFEGLPLIAIEAIAVGLPVVATMTSGLCDVLPVPCLYEFGDAKGLQLALNRLRDPACREASVAEARRALGGLLSDRVYHEGIRAAMSWLHGGPPKESGLRPSP